MATKDNAEPTDAEVAAAQDVMRRRAEAQAKAAADKLKPIADIVGSAEYTKVRDAVEALPIDFMADMNVAPHIMALRAGLNGLAAVVPAALPATDPAPAA